MEILCDKKCIIGESPVWNEFNEKLYQTNGFGNEIVIIDIFSKEVTLRSLPFGVAAIAFSKNGDMLISKRDGAFILNDDNSLTPLYDTKKHEIKYGNDAKVGPDGRFYVGTMSSKRKGVGEEIDGKLYSIDNYGNVKTVLDGLILSNGFDWSMDEKRLYHTDSDTGIIKEYDFDKNTGDISFTGRQIKVPGVDGFTIDKNDFLYVACWGQSHIAVVDTKTMQTIEYIPVPAKIPASCCFAGKNMENLIIVTANYDETVKFDTHAGKTFIKNTTTFGRKPYLF